MTTSERDMATPPAADRGGGECASCEQSDNCPRCKHSMDHHVSFNTGRAIRCNYDNAPLFQPCRCDEFVGKPKPRSPQGDQAMTDPTDALRAECEKALEEWWFPRRFDDMTTPSTGFRAGFNVLAARVEAWCWRLETEREEDFVIRQMKRDIAADLRAAIANRPEGE